MRRAHWTTSLVVALLAALAAGCAPLVPGQGELPTLAPTEATVAPSATAAPTITAPPPTATPRPTATTIAVASPTPIPGELELSWSSLSPDGQWMALAHHANLHQGESYYVRLRVEGSAGAQVWLPVSEWRPMGLGYTLPGLLQWSADSQRLYFTNVPHPDGCSLFVNGGDVQVLDLASGQVTELMPEQALWVALSPDETRVAYIGYGDRGLIVRDLATGAEQSVNVPRPVPGATLGAIVWAPDGTALALTASHDPCGIDGVTSVFHVDLATGAVRTLVAGDRRGFRTIGWEVLGRIGLVDGEGIPYEVNVDTGELVPPEVAGEATVDWTMTSPDGQWEASASTTDPEAGDGLFRTTLTVARRDATVAWMPIDEIRSAGLGSSFIRAVRWSADGTGFYFTNQVVVDGCAWYVNGTGLYRLDLESGTVTPLLPETGLALELSPDETKVAYSGAGDMGLIVRNLKTTADRVTDIPAGEVFPRITQVVWSPDSTQLAVTLVADACVQLEPGRYLTAIVDAETGAARTLLDHDPRLLTIESWTEPARVKLMDWDGGYWWLDVATGAVTAQ